MSVLNIWNILISGLCCRDGLRGFHERFDIYYPHDILTTIGIHCNSCKSKWTSSAKWRPFRFRLKRSGMGLPSWRPTILSGGEGAWAGVGGRAIPRYTVVGLAFMHRTSPRNKLCNRVLVLSLLRTYPGWLAVANCRDNKEHWAEHSHSGFLSLEDQITSMWLLRSGKLTVVENKNGQNNESKVPSLGNYKKLNFVFQCKCWTPLHENEKTKLILCFKFLAKNKTQNRH